MLFLHLLNKTSIDFTAQRHMYYGLKKGILRNILKGILLAKKYHILQIPINQMTEVFS